MLIFDMTTFTLVKRFLLCFDNNNNDNKTCSNSNDNNENNDNNKSGNNDNNIYNKWLHEAYTFSELACISLDFGTQPFSPENRKW